MKIDILLSLLLFSLFFSPSFTAEYEQVDVENGNQINPIGNEGLEPLQLCNDSDINGPDYIVEAVFPGNVSFQAPSLISDITFPSVTSQGRAFPFTLRVSYQWFLEDNTTCMAFTYDHPVDTSDDLFRWKYIASFVPNYCLPTMDNPGPSIRVVSSFCSVEPEAYVTFFATMDSVQSETMFKSNTQIPLPGPRAALTAQYGVDLTAGSVNPTVNYGEMFTFELKGKSGRFTITLDDTEELNQYFTHLSVGHASYSENTVISLEEATGFCYSMGVKRVDGEPTTFYFTLVEVNDLDYDKVAGFVEFDQDDDDDFPLGWVIGGVVGGLLLIIAFIVAFVVFKKFSSKPDYNEFE